MLQAQFDYGNELKWLIFLQIVKITMDEAEMDSFVFCLAHKRVMTKMLKDMLDLVCIIFLWIYFSEIHFLN